MMMFSYLDFFPTGDRNLNVPIKYIWRDFQEISKPFRNINSLISSYPERWPTVMSHYPITHERNWDLESKHFPTGPQEGVAGTKALPWSPPAHLPCLGRWWNVWGAYYVPGAGFHSSVFNQFPIPFYVHNNPDIWAVSGTGPEWTV